MTEPAVTLIVAALCGLFYVGLSLRVIQGRVGRKISLGDGGEADMRLRIRIHANFIEYVPLALILLGLVEATGGNRTFLAMVGAALIAARILHVIGLPRPAPNACRFLGTAGSLAILVVLSVYGLALAR